MLALTFANKEDYLKIKEDDVFDIIGLTSFAPEKPLTMVIHHSDGTQESITVNHTYNKNQIDWFKAGSALNAMGKARATGKSTAKKSAGKKPVTARKAVKKVAKKVAKKAAKKVIRKVAKSVKKKVVKPVKKAGKRPIRKVAKAKSKKVSKKKK